MDRLYTTVDLTRLFEACGEVPQVKWPLTISTADTEALGLWRDFHRRGAAAGY
jgi:hypothetical protein